jgi:hypothetical protein
VSGNKTDSEGANNAALCFPALRADRPRRFQLDRYPAIASSCSGWLKATHDSPALFLICAKTDCLIAKFAALVVEVLKKEVGLLVRMAESESTVAPDRRRERDKSAIELVLVS